MPGLIDSDTGLTYGVSDGLCITPGSGLGSGGLGLSSGIADDILFPALSTNSQTFYAPGVALRLLKAGLVTNVAVFPAPTVTHT